MTDTPEDTIVTRARDAFNAAGGSPGNFLNIGPATFGEFEVLRQNWVNRPENQGLSANRAPSGEVTLYGGEDRIRAAFGNLESTLIAGRPATELAAPRQWMRALLELEGIHFPSTSGLSSYIIRGNLELLRELRSAFRAFDATYTLPAGTNLPEITLQNNELHVPAAGLIDIFAEAIKTRDTRAARSRTPFKPALTTDILPSVMTEIRDILRQNTVDVSQTTDGRFRISANPQICTRLGELIRTLYASSDIPLPEDAITSTEGGTRLLVRSSIGCLTDALSHPKREEEAAEGAERHKNQHQQDDSARSRRIERQGPIRGRRGMGMGMGMGRGRMRRRRRTKRVLLMPCLFHASFIPRKLNLHQNLCLKLPISRKNSIPCLAPSPNS
jgi:hypothetical protein